MKIKILFLLICLMFINLTAQKQKVEKHEIEVSAAILPLFAYSNDGSPVYNIRGDEIEVFVNKKKVKFFLVSQDFNQQDTKIAKKKTYQKRVNILFIDNVFSSRKTVRNSKDMALKMIKNSTQADKFMIITLTPSGTLQYMNQPTNNKNQLKKNINSIKAYKPIFDKNLFTQDDHFASIDKSPSDRDLDTINNYSERLAYKHAMVNLRQQFISLKYLLKTIKVPKLFFWLSEGFATGVFQTDIVQKKKAASPNIENSSSIIGALGSHVLKLDKTSGYSDSLYSGYLINMVRDMSLAVTLGGGIIYAINTGELEQNTDKPLNRGDFSLSILANESGGRMFKGSNRDLIEEEIKKETAAYYDLGVYLNKNSTKYMNLKVKCLRKGVNINVAKTISLEQNFEKLNELERKLFLLSNFDSSVDSKSTNRIFDIKPVFLNIKESRNKVEATMKINVPQIFVNKPLYFYQILRNKKVNTEIKLLQKVFFEQKTNKIKITHPVNSALTYLWYDSESDQVMRIKLLVHKK